MKSRVIYLLIAAAPLFRPMAEAQSFSLESADGLTLVGGLKAATAPHKGRKALLATSGNEDQAGLAIVNSTSFQDGTIEIELAGEPGPGANAAARGFVGVAFRVASDGKKFELFYLRPTNGRADDQERRNHSAQYDSAPDYPWFRLRKETPGKYESYVDLVPGEWTKVKITVRGDKAKLFVHGSDQPTLVVNDLKLGVSKGAIALFAGPGTVAHFSNLKVTR